ncbi:unnamed protein product [Absidia cylindrospora]
MSRNLHEAQKTILLQQKQITSYENLIKKQNDKIQLLRYFIHKRHGKQQLDKVEASQPVSPLSTIDECHVTSSRRTLPSSIKSSPPHHSNHTAKHPPQHANNTTTDPPHDSNNTTTDPPHNSNNTTKDPPHHSNNTVKEEDNDNNAIIHIRLGQRDMHSFFFDTTDPRPPSQSWEICASYETNDTLPSISAVLEDDEDEDDTIPTQPPPPPPPISVTEISSQSSHTTDGEMDGALFTIESTPPPQQKQSVIISPISNTPITRQQTALWDPSKSPSNRRQPSLTIHHNDQPTTTFGQYRDRMYQSSSSSKQRSTLTSIDANQPSRNKDDDHFLKRPAPDSEFPYAEVVRKKDERAKLHGVTCACCAKYFENSTSTSGSAQDRIQKYSRHRERYKQPSTPPGFWDLDFPDSPLNG